MWHPTLGAKICAERVWNIPYKDFSISVGNQQKSWTTGLKSSHPPVNFQRNLEEEELVRPLPMARCKIRSLFSLTFILRLVRKLEAPASLVAPKTRKYLRFEDWLTNKFVGQPASTKKLNLFDWNKLMCQIIQKYYLNLTLSILINIYSFDMKHTKPIWFDPL